MTITTVLAASCEKSNIKYRNTATITGTDYTVGSCHGLYFITINDPSANHTFDTLPAYSGIDLRFITPKMPLRVQLNWHNMDGCDKIVIEEIATLK